MVDGKKYQVKFTGTVEPGYGEHQVDMPKCSISSGVGIKRLIAEKIYGLFPIRTNGTNLQYPGVRIKCVSTEHKVELHCSISLVTKKKNWYVQDSTISVNSVCILQAFPV